MPKSQLLTPLPPFVNKEDPKVIAWRQDQHAQAIEHLHETKIEFSNRSWLPLIGVILTLTLGLLGLLSPAEIARLLKFFVL